MLTQIPEDKPQIIMAQALATYEKFDVLVELLKFLHQRGKLGTGAVLAWAKHVDTIGDHAKLLETLANFIRVHPSRADDNWMGMVQEAKQDVLASCEKDTSLDSEWCMSFFLPEQEPMKKKKKKKIYDDEF